MKKNIVRKLMLLPVLAAMALPSCVMGEEEPVVPVTVDDATVTFSVSVPGNSTPSTRGLSVDDETNVETIDVLLFYLDGADRKYYGSVPGVSLDNTAGTTKSFTVNIPTKDHTNYDMSIVANCRDELTAAAIARGTLKNAALNSLVKSQSAGAKWNSNRIPMWGEAVNVTISAGLSLTNVKMTRMVSRIDVKLSTKAASGSDSGTGNGNFALSQVNLYNYSTSGTVVPDLAGGWDTTTDATKPFATAPNEPGSGYGRVIYDGTTNMPLQYTAADQHSSAQNMPNSLERVIYTLEAPQGSATDLDNNVCLVVGGSYKGGSTTWYRIDFATKVSNAYNYMPLKRNFLYTVTVTNITGPGFATPDEAFHSKPANIEADILPWNEFDMNDIIFDHTNFLSVSPGKFDFYAELTTENLTIATDVPVVNGSNWTATIYNDEAGSDEMTTNPWLSISQSSGSVVYNPSTQLKSTVAVTADANTSGATRTGWIHIRSGRLTFKVRVIQGTQPKPEDYVIKVTTDNGSGIDVEVSELYFMGANESTAPAPQDFKVTWGPSGSLLGVNIVVPTTDAISATYSPDITAVSVLENGTTGHTYTVSPAARNYSGSDPFFEKSTRILFTLQTPSGPTVKTLDLRQTNFALQPKSATILMNGKEQSFNVLANFTWKVEFVSETNLDNPGQIVTRFDEQYGGNNITTGDPVKLTCSNYIDNYDSNNPMKAQVTMKFYRLDKGQWIDFMDHTVTCYSAVPGAPSNTYMIDWNEPVPVLITVADQLSRAMATSGNGGGATGLLPYNWVTDADFTSSTAPLRAQILWSDVNDFTTDGAVVKDVALSGASLSDAAIVVVPGKPYIESGVKGGNSLVILYKDNNNTGFYDTGDEIKWSWHIWNTEYVAGGTYLYPLTKPTTNGKHAAVNGGDLYKFGANNNNIWMDRNLGAIGGNVKPTGINKDYELGFHYQWGRKDPLPGSNMATSTSTANRTNIYYAPNVPAALKYDNSTTKGTGLVNAVNWPQWHNFNTVSPYDWYGTTSCYELWGQPSSTSALYNANSTAKFVNQTTGKSAYDPCPEGWRVPRGQQGSADTYSPWSGWLGQTFPQGQGYDNASYGYWPAAGYRNTGSAALGNVGNNGYYWSSSLSTANTAYSRYLYFRYNNGINPSSSSNRGYGFSVRCVAE